MTRGLTRTGFDEDIVIGQEAEGVVAAMLGSSRVEVKADQRGMETGRVFVEYSCRGKPSGIATSPADWWVYVVAGRIIALPVGDLRALVKAALTERGPVRGGDYDQSEGVLIPLTWFTMRPAP